MSTRSAGGNQEKMQKGAVGNLGTGADQKRCLPSQLYFSIFNTTQPLIHKR